MNFSGDLKFLDHSYEPSKSNYWSGLFQKSSNLPIEEKMNKI
jgi:hypothetical protein